MNDVSERLSFFAALYQVDRQPAAGMWLLYGTIFVLAVIVFKLALYETIIKHVPAPVDNAEEPLQFQVALLDYNDYVGRIGIGRVFRGTMKVGQQVSLMKLA